MHIHKWDIMFDQLKVYRKEHEFEPSEDDFPELAKWYRTQKNNLVSNKLSNERTEKIKSITFLGPSTRNKWHSQFEQLLVYRINNPEKWPSYDRIISDSDESQLAIFCQTIRKRYRENNLGSYWLDKFLDLDFNFVGAKDNWTIRFEYIKDLLKNKMTASSSELENKDYSWIIRHKKKCEEGKLSKYQTDKINELELNNYFISWDNNYEKVVLWKKTIINYL